MKKIWQAIVLYCWFVIGGLVLLNRGTFTITQFWYGILGSFILATLVGQISSAMIAGWVMDSKGMNPDELKDKYITLNACAFFAFIAAGFLGLWGLPTLITLIFG